ncbi:MAG: hypothetical protein PHE89_01185 [Alphaproteobacteria bacterium]|nr:hypothetical protein [Alphaproteobacteria bacterium]
MNKPNNLPDLNDLTFAISDAPLGQGTEARVFKIHTKPQYTLRVSIHISNSEQLINILNNSKIVLQKDFFENRNFAQTVAIFEETSRPKDNFPLVSINRYVPGFSLDIGRLNIITKDINKYNNLSADEKKQESENVLSVTKKLSEMVLNIGDDKYDKLFDDLHFLSSIKQSIDCGGGLYTNMGNILYSGNENQLNIIDLQPFRTEAPGINRNHTKGSNSPFNLLHGILPGSYFYRNQDYLLEKNMTIPRDDHSKDKELIKMRTEIVEKVISAAERNNLNDLNNYSMTNMQGVHRAWSVVLEAIRTPENLRGNFIFRLNKIKDEVRYKPRNNQAMNLYQRVGRYND